MAVTNKAVFVAEWFLQESALHDQGDARSTELEGVRIIGKASNGVEAVHLFEKSQPDLVTMDITMPEMDGIECVERLVGLNPDVLILVVSALSDKATAIEALKKGANGFLCKPFTDKQLNDALAELIGATVEQIAPTVPGLAELAAHRQREASAAASGVASARA